MDEMRLSELVKFKNNLSKTVDVKGLIPQLDNIITELLSMHNYDLDHEFKDLITKMATQFKDVKSKLTTPVAEMSQAIHRVDEKIEEHAHRLFSYSYNDSLRLDPEGERVCRVMNFSDEAHNTIVSRIRIYADWHYPGLEIGPGDGVWTEELVGLDPLYLADINQEYLDNTLSKFNPTYQRRLRPYLIDNSNPNLKMLPQNQFGFVFSFNVFEYLPLESFKLYLREVFDLLRPGGTFMVSYNNCERWHGAYRAETHTASFMTKTLLLSLANLIGYETVATFDLDNFISWVEIKKPGELKTVKGHQAMGEIKHKNS